MYRKLEDGRSSESAADESPSETVATEGTPDGECTCTCNEPTENGDEPAPAVKESTVFYPVWYDING